MEGRLEGYLAHRRLGEQEKQGLCFFVFPYDFCVCNIGIAHWTMFSRLYRVYLQRFALDCSQSSSFDRSWSWSECSKHLRIQNSFQFRVSTFCLRSNLMMAPDSPIFLSGRGTKTLAHQWGSHETLLKHWLSWQSWWRARLWPRISLNIPDQFEHFFHFQFQARACSSVRHLIYNVS